MISGEIEVWKKGKYSPFCRAVRIKSNGKEQKTDLFSPGQGELNCTVISQRPGQLTCKVAIIEPASTPEDTVLFTFNNLPKKGGRHKVQGRDLSGKLTSWIGVFVPFPL